MPKVNQKAIADQLGISRATVSRCFTNHAGINATTRAKVFQLAAEMGYAHLESRSPAVKKAKKRVNFNVLICSDTEEYFRDDYKSPGEQILVGVSEFAQAHQVDVDVDFIPPSVTSIDDPAFAKIKSLKSRKNRGVLLIYPFADSIIKELSHQLPLVSLVDQLEHESIDCADVDHSSGISMVIDQLIAKGHRKIGFYTRDYTIAASWSFRRYSAFVEKMARKKLKVSNRDIIGIFPRTFGSVASGIDEAIKRTKEGVTAWVCAADHQGYDLIDGFENHGLKVPEDVSITGFDGIQRSADRPALTTIDIPFRAIGMTGADRLASRIRQRFGGSQSIYISGTLIEGETVGTPKS
ncbi:LacI family transcriptional regulator [Akkermansiaceae bacterium]|mgnify:FL=1|jgi:LacI family transcriptional regulator|nr:LacI family DNA-binding transcriptional regulator [Verrucomicrobiota bacterium]MDA7500018.1 LacI family transcriptional regulator [Akkermansiaceae bacterium]MDB4660004.1 LacI family transcriptional regulator [bacterium]MDA7528484.1 LacI family transcriptional regulator [Akkermansiaceae bacterium]MDA7651429.1 LacI family transcriptional regulator [Akkermansiaceae bacterium]